MATATIITPAPGSNNPWSDGRYVYLAVRVTSDSVDGVDTEYVGSTLLLDGLGNQKTLAQLKAEVVADIKRRRDAQKVKPAQPQAITGTVTI